MPHSESTMSNNTDADHFDREDVDAVAACLGDDAAQLREDNDEDERATNMDRAASMLTWMLLTHPVYSAGAQPAAQEPVEEAVRAAGRTFTDPKGQKWSFDPTCKACRGAGRVVVGYSGREDDGNAPLWEDCDCFIPVSASPHPAPQQPVRMLTDDEVQQAHREALQARSSYPEAIQRKFCEVNGLTIGAPQQPDARDALVRELVEALQLGRAHAKWSADRSKDATERRLNQRDVDRIDAALSKAKESTS